MTQAKSKFLLDLNTLIALAEPDHEFHKTAGKWFQTEGKENWGVCPLTEAGFIRITTHPKYRPASRTVQQAAAILTSFAEHPGYHYWPIVNSWATLTAPFSARIFGHQQVTDAYLLGLAMKEHGVLVTFDSGFSVLAGAEYSRNLRVLAALP
jgi:toxin-antitoxin system PIN domain toxin